jgi:hypothetical protein
MNVSAPKKKVGANANFQRLPELVLFRRVRSLQKIAILLKRGLGPFSRPLIQPHPTQRIIEGYMSLSCVSVEGSVSSCGNIRVSRQSRSSGGMASSCSLRDTFVIGVGWEWETPLVFSAWEVAPKFRHPPPHLSSAFHLLRSITVIDSHHHQTAVQ